MRNKANLISIGLRMRHPPGSEKIPLVQPNTALVGDFRRVLKLVVSAQGSEAKLQSFHSLPPRICGAWIVGACTENPFKTAANCLSCSAWEPYPNFCGMESSAWPAASGSFSTHFLNYLADSADHCRGRNSRNKFPSAGTWAANAFRVGWH